MTLELASERVVRKPWGRPICARGANTATMGRRSASYGSSALMQGPPSPACCSSCSSPTSRCRSRFIRTTLRARDRPAARQDRGLVHPLGRAKCEGGAGLKRKLTAPQLRAAISDGSIAALVRWQDVKADDTVSSGRHNPRHRRGPRDRRDSAAQRRDIPPVRLWPQRELHLDGAVAAAPPGPSAAQPIAERLDRRAARRRAQSLFRSRADRSAVELLLGDRCRERDLGLAARGGCQFRSDRREVRRGDLYRGSASAGACRLDRNQGPHGICGERAIQHAAPRSQWRAARRHGRTVSRTRSGSTAGCSPAVGPALVSKVRRIAFIGNSLPRRCGIATFTTDLQQAVAARSIATSIVAMTDHGRAYDYPASVGFQIRDDNLADYVAAADHINEGGFDVVSLQHEFGIFGGEAGGHILALLSRLHHAGRHDAAHRARRSRRTAQRARAGAHRRGVFAQVVVMAEKGRDLLRDASTACPPTRSRSSRTAFPISPSSNRTQAKAKLGFAGKIGHPDLRPAVSQQGHRGHDRRHAVDPADAGPTPSMSCSARRIPIWSATRARPIATA